MAGGRGSAEKAPNLDAVFVQALISSAMTDARSRVCRPSKRRFFQRPGWLAITCPRFRQAIRDRSVHKQVATRGRDDADRD